MKWSVSIIAEGDRVMDHDEVVALADAVAGFGGIASGIASMHYGAQVVVDADDRDTAVRRAVDVFARAAARAGLPSWPVAHVETISEADE